MINFVKLVESSLLIEAVQTFLQNLSNFFHAHYDPQYDFPVPGTDPKLEQAIQMNLFVTRTTGENVVLDPAVRKHYPYIDYLCYVNDLFKTATGSTTNLNIKDLASTPDIDNYTADYIKQAQANFRGTLGTMDPIIIYYKPVSYKLKAIHDKVVAALVTNGLLGKIAIQNYIAKNFNLIEAINDVVVLRQQTTTQPRPKQRNTEIEDFIINYREYLPGGSKNMPSRLQKNGEYYVALAESIEKYAAAKSIPAKDAITKSIKDISQDSQGKEVIENLSRLANFIPEKPSLSQIVTKTLDAGTKLVQGLSFGVPTVGSKR